ncbi:unnamed protein product [Boreogadus saida]
MLTHLCSIKNTYHNRLLGLAAMASPTRSSQSWRPCKDAGSLGYGPESLGGRAPTRAPLAPGLARASSDPDLPAPESRSTLALSCCHYTVGQSQDLVLTWDIREQVDAGDWIGMYHVGELPWGLIGMYHVGESPWGLIGMYHVGELPWGLIGMYHVGESPWGLIGMYHVGESPWGLIGMYHVGELPWGLIGMYHVGESPWGLIGMYHVGESPWGLIGMYHLGESPWGLIGMYHLGELPWGLIGMYHLGESPWGLIGMYHLGELPWGLIGMYHVDEPLSENFLDYKNRGVNGSKKGQIVWKIEATSYLPESGGPLCFRYYHGGTGALRATTPTLTVTTPAAPVS